MLDHAGITVRANVFTHQVSKPPPLRKRLRVVAEQAASEGIGSLPSPCYVHGLPRYESSHQRPPPPSPAAQREMAFTHLQFPSGTLRQSPGICLCELIT